MVSEHLILYTKNSEWVYFVFCADLVYILSLNHNSALKYKMIDEIDWKIIEQLQINARTSFAELGRRIGLTTPAIIERVRKLEDAEIIAGYRAEIDLSKVGLPVTAFIRMNITGVDYSKIIEVAENSKEVLECHRGTGGDSFIFKVAVADVGHLQTLIDSLTPYGMTTTSIVLSSPVKRRNIKKTKN